jgi:hypothetical protein
MLTRWADRPTFFLVRLGRESQRKRPAERGVVLVVASPAFSARPGMYGLFLQTTDGTTRRSRASVYIVAAASIVTSASSISTGYW